jgi:hypothetical protein
MVMARNRNKRVQLKISKLLSEGKPMKQAVAIALKMEEEKRLGPRGGYKKKKSSLQSKKSSPRRLILYRARPKWRKKMRYSQRHTMTYCFLVGLFCQTTF